MKYIKILNQTAEIRKFNWNAYKNGLSTFESMRKADNKVFDDAMQTLENLKVRGLDAYTMLQAFLSSYESNYREDIIL